MFLLPRLALDGIDLVHAHFLLPQGLAGVLISRATGAPLVLTAAGSDVNVLATHTLMREIIQHIIFPHSQVVAVSQPLLRKLEALGCRNIRYIPNCVEMPADHVAVQQLSKILFVGHLIPEKRPDVLVRAFSKVASQVSDATLTVVGSGPMQKDLQTLTSNLGLVRRVCFTGYLNDEELMPIYKESGIFVMPSVSEGLSVAVLEAMSFGLRVIVSEPAGSEIIEDGVHGLVFRVDDVDELVGRILWVIKNPAKSSQLSSNARSLCEREYAVSVVAPKLEQLYAEACSRD